MHILINVSLPKLPYYDLALKKGSKSLSKHNVTKLFYFKIQIKRNLRSKVVQFLQLCVCVCVCVWVCVRVCVCGAVSVYLQMSVRSSHLQIRSWVSGSAD